MMRVVMLGCGASVGVPSLSGGWGSCDPAEPRNRRRRCSILVETAGGRILVDTSPDLREQLLDAGVGAVDAVLFTHHHADHPHAIDDLRPLYWSPRQRIPPYAVDYPTAHLQARLRYLFVAVPPCPPPPATP